MPMKTVELSLWNLYKSYHGRTVLEDVTFTFAPGGRYALRGENGCGKTTLLNILAGYDEPDSGAVVSQARIAYLFQDDMVFSNLTVEENMKIKLYAGNTGRKPRVSKKDRLKEEGVVINRVLEVFGIAHLLKQKTVFLSGGERQRLGLAQIMMSQPDVILLDEPTAKLDDQNKDKFVHIITTAFEGKTLIMVTHDQTVVPWGFVSLRLEGGELRCANG